MVICTLHTAVTDSIILCMFLCTFLLRKVHKNVATRAAPYGSNMHQIVCQTPLGELTALPRESGWGPGRKEEEKGKRRGKKREGKGREKEGGRERGEERRRGWG